MVFAALSVCFVRNCFFMLREYFRSDLAAMTKRGQMLPLGPAYADPLVIYLLEVALSAPVPKELVECQWV
jgi:hypothetical protein